jgi:RND family efflux transporter MFP subunit
METTDLAQLQLTEAQRRPSRRRRRWPWAVLALVCLVIAGAMVMRPAEVRVAAAQYGRGGPAEEGKAILTANGYVEARHQAAVAARTTGRLAAVYVEEGDSVAAEAVVAKLIDDDQRAQVARAQADLALARAQLAQADVVAADARRRADRRDQMLTAGLIGAEEGEGAGAEAAGTAAARGAARASVEVAAANLEGARLELDKTLVRAPFAGIVLRKDAEVGEIVGPIMTSNTARAGAVVTVADMTTLEVGVDINESYIAKLGPATAADIVLDAHPETHFPGEVRAIFPSADRDKATVPVRVRFLAADGRVRPDLGAKVTFLEQRATTQIVSAPRVLRVPAAAVRAGVIMVVRAGKLVATTPRLGERRGDDVEVLEGLAEGDQVVIAGPSRLRAGQRVRVARNP